MKKSLKLLTVTIVLCFLALPAASYAAYESLYANAADSIFADDTWTGFEEVSLDGATYAYHVWYDVDGVRADYYAAWYDGYSSEWLTYESGVGDESWLYTAALDGSYQVAEENFDYADYDLEYMLYDDGTTYQMEYDFESVDGSYDGWYDYSVYMETQASGYYDYDYYYNNYNVGWSYEVENDVNNAQTYEDKWFDDRVNGEYYEINNWKSTATGSYSNYAYTVTGTTTDMGTSWDWDYDEETWTYSSFSADYSSYWSSYRKNTYSDAGNTYYSMWDGEITDSGYYYKGWSWNNNIDDEGESYYESFYLEDGTNALRKYYDKYDDVSDYYSSYFEYTDSGNYELDEYYYYNDDYYLSYSRYEDWDPEQSGEMETGYSYTWQKDQLYYYEYGENDYNNDTGYTYYYKSVESRDWTDESSRYYGSGYYDQVSYGYDPDIQENWYNKNYEVFAKGYYQRRTYDYYYNEWKLADSDEHYIYWNLYNSDPDTGSTDTYTRYNYRLHSDTGDESWSYEYDDYTGPNNQYYNESHWKNVYTGVYDNYESFQISGVSSQATWQGQSLDYWYSSNYAEDYVADTWSWSDYSYNLTSGAQYWEAGYLDYSTGPNTWSHTILANVSGDGWIGNKTVWDGANYDLYYYVAYPDAYFMEDDQSSLPGFMPGYPYF